MWHYLLGIVGIILVNVALVYLPRLIGDTTDGLANGLYTMEDLWGVALFAGLIGIGVFTGRIMCGISSWEPLERLSMISGEICLRIWRHCRCVSIMRINRAI